MAKSTLSFGINSIYAIEIEQAAKMAGLTLSGALREAALQWLEGKKRPQPQGVPAASDTFDPDSEPNVEWS